MTPTHGLPTTVLLLLLCSSLPALHCAMRFEYCMWFRGSCELSCGPDSFPLYGSSWCSSPTTRCCVRILNPPLASTTTTTPVPLPGCGRKGRGMLTGRIVGGQPAGRCEFPWVVHVARQPGDTHPCGAALVDQRTIVTAAHCFSDLGGYTPEITIGEYNRNERYLPSEKFTTTNYKVTKHPHYSSGTLFNDIAILQLYTPIDYRKYRCIQPLCLPARGMSFLPGTNCIAAGWGVTEREFNIVNPPVSPVLLKVALPIVDKALCTATFGQFFNSSVELCAGQLDGTRDTCRGDSGGPLMCPSGSGNEYYLAGIVSSGGKCAQPNIPAVYTDVTQFLSWIHDVMGSG